jgi:putative ATP-binding cassette transporter
MSADAASSIFDRKFFRDLWRLTRVYWTSPKARAGALFLVLAVALELGTVQANVGVADAQRALMDALAERDAGAFGKAVALVLGLAVLALLVGTYRIFVRQLVEVSWRSHLTRHYLGRWVGPEAFCQSQMHAGDTDNPDQRIHEDIRDYVASALGLSLSLVGAVATLVSFGGVLWRLSGEWSIDVGSREVHVPGIMLWVAVLYAMLAMWVTHLVGRPLVSINYDRLRFEADFRYGLVRFRDNVEAVALSRGEEVERRGAIARFRRVITNFLQLIRAQRRLTILTLGIGQLNDIVPLLVAVPAYFANHLTLGGVIQTRIAYASVSGALTWFVNAYQEIARWRASIVRVASLADAMDVAARDLHGGEQIQFRASPDRCLHIDDLELRLPDGRPILTVAHARIAPGDRVVVIGPSGAGKTTLFRAIAGIWPCGTGHIAVPDRTRTLALPQRAYLPMGRLRDALVYPASGDAFSDDQLRQVLQLLNLTHLWRRLDATEQWDHTLSVPEQQRVALARVFLHAPEWVLLDESTSGLDEAMEERVYALLTERLPHAAIVSVAHRASIVAQHAQQWVLVPESGRPTRLDVRAALG